jgi:outer membrane protein
MRKQLCPLIAFLLVTTSGALPARGASTPGEEPRSLDDCYAAALKRSDTVAMQADLIDEFEEQYKQSISAVAPAINGTGSYQLQETPSNSTASSLFPSTQGTLKVTADQPLFRGFREFAGIRQRVALRDSQVATWRQAAAQLYSDTSAAYYNVLSLERQLADLYLQRDADVKYVNELIARMKIGRSRETDVLTERVQVATLDAQIETQLGLISTAREVLVFLTAYPKDIPLKGEGDLSSKTMTLESYINRVDDRPDVLAATRALDAAKEGVPLAWGQHLPSLDLVGDYYLARPGLLSDVHWDVALTGSIPIFAGLSILSQTRQAEAAVRQADHSADNIKRTAEQQIRTYYSSVQSDLLQVDKYAKATDLAIKTYQQEIHDYRLGLVTILDVLQAESSAWNTRRTLDAARFQARLDLVNLEVSAAERPAGLSNPLF